jgi:hypothetical protein
MYDLQPLPSEFPYTVYEEFFFISVCLHTGRLRCYDFDLFSDFPDPEVDSQICSKKHLK